ncbi:MAG: RecX family transcriptional regulator [Acholeplasmataceae bacterium]|nr:RecX family transcriptional regulator [Acholeplasmataceae bacterium]
MMKTIHEIEKKTQYYKVRFDDEWIMIEPEIFLKFHLKLLQTYDSKSYHQLIMENDYAHYYKLGIIHLKKMQTTKELSDYLRSKGAQESIVKQLVTKFIEKKYLDDYAYTKLYVQMKQNNDGPLMIFNKLREKGVSAELIESFTKHIDEDQILSRLLPKKISAIKNKSKKQAIQSLKGYYLRKGFSLEAVEAQIKKSMSSYQVDELELIKKEYAKLIKKYHNMEDQQVEYKIIQKLYAKGFKIEDIKKAIQS